MPNFLPLGVWRFADNSGRSRREFQILCGIEAVGLCFSDLKFLKQFSSHVRKSQIVSGIEQKILKDIPSYVPDEMPAVPGHETVIRIEAVGDGVENFKIGQRYLIQTDYRWLATPNSNAAFGYNFEGALQQYVLMDERIITSPEGDSMLIPVSEELSASAVALVEPWACVEDAYACKERRTLKVKGKLLIAAAAMAFVQPGKIGKGVFFLCSAPGHNLLFVLCLTVTGYSVYLMIYVRSAEQ